MFIIWVGSLKPNSYDGNNSLSSDDELFQECENGFDLDSTAVLPTVASTRAHSSNIDHNAFDKTINFSSITANSTAGLATTSDVSLPEKSDILFQSGIGDQTINGDSISSTHTNSVIHSSAIENVPEVPSVESFAKTPESLPVEEPSAKIEIVVEEHVESATEKADVDQTATAPTLEEDATTHAMSGEEQKATVSLNQTIDMNVTAPIQSDDVNGTHSQNESSVNDDQTHNAMPSATSDRAHSSNIDSNVFDKTINCSSIAANSTAGLTTTPDVSISSPTVDNSDVFSQTGAADQTINVESISSTHANEANQSNDFASVPEKSSEESLKSQEEVICAQEQPAQVTVEIPVGTSTEEGDVDDVTVKTPQEEPTGFENVPAKVDDMVKGSETPDVASVQNFTELQQVEEVPTPTEVEPPVATANQTFEAMDVDMNETVDIQQPSTDAFVDNQLGASNVAEEIQMNQTVEMVDLDQADDVAQPSLNVTVDVAATLNDQTLILSAPAISSQLPEEKGIDNKDMNTTQVLSEEPKSTVLLNQTIDLSSAKTSTTPPSQSSNGVNETFVQNGSPTLLNQTHNVTKDFLSSTHYFDAGNSKNATVVLPKANLNETVVVDNKLPSMNTSYVVSPSVAVSQPNQLDETFETAPEQKETTFKLPAKPTKTTNPFDLKNQAQNQFDVSDDEFQSPGRKFRFFILFFLFLYLFHFCSSVVLFLLLFAFVLVSIPVWYYAFLFD